MTHKVAHIWGLQMGCDPEFFFSRDGKIQGAETVIPKDGLKYERLTGYPEGGPPTYVEEKMVTIDGVQAEINPQPTLCREGLAGNITSCFLSLHERIKDDKTLKVNFSQVKTIGKKELEKLSDDAKKFGCAPSKNIHNEEDSGSIKIDASKYRTRSAGGHIHLGKAGHSKIDSALNNPEKLVAVLDILLGNTCVLIDRNPKNKERRKLYGRAGEYRMTEWGIEYRTLSNFWLQSYPLMSMVFGIARLAVDVVANDIFLRNNPSRTLIKEANIEKVLKAINENNFDLAYENFERIEPLLGEMFAEYGRAYAFQNMKEFKHFITKKTDYWFKEDPLQHWISGRGGQGGWERFLFNTVRNDMLKIK